MNSSRSAPWTTCAERSKTARFTSYVALRRGDRTRLAAALEKPVGNASSWPWPKRSRGTGRVPARGRSRDRGRKRSAAARHRGRSRWAGDLQAPARGRRPLVGYDNVAKCWRMDRPARRWCCGPDFRSMCGRCGSRATATWAAVFYRLQVTQHRVACHRQRAQMEAERIRTFSGKRRIAGASEEEVYKKLGLA